MGKKRHALIIIGLAFFIVAPSFAFVLTPSMKKIPDNLDKVVYYEGTLGAFDTETLSMDYIEISIRRNVTALEKYTSENVLGYGDTERIGQYVFPVGVEKKDYLIWNSDMDEPYTLGYVELEDATAIGYYMGTEKRGGITVYKFDGSQEEIYIGSGPEGTPPESRLYYAGHQTAWADPKTGSIIDYDKRVIQYLEFPDLHQLPSDLDTTARLAGSVDMFNMDKVGTEDY